MTNENENLNDSAYVPESMLAFDYGKVAEEMKVGIIVVHNGKLLLIPYLLINSKQFRVTLTGDILCELCEEIGQPCEKGITSIGFTTLSE